MVGKLLKGAGIVMIAGVVIFNVAQGVKGEGGEGVDGSHGAPLPPAEAPADPSETKEPEQKAPKEEPAEQPPAQEGNEVREAPAFEGSFQEQVGAALDATGTRIPGSRWFRPMGDTEAVAEHFDFLAIKYPDAGLVGATCGHVALADNAELVGRVVGDNVDKWTGRVVVSIVEDPGKAADACTEIILTGLEKSPADVQLYTPGT